MVGGGVQGRSSEKPQNQERVRLCRKMRQNKKRKNGAILLEKSKKKGQEKKTERCDFCEHRENEGGRDQVLFTWFFVTLPPAPTRQVTEYPYSYLWRWPYQKTNNLIRSCHPKCKKVRTRCGGPPHMWFLVGCSPPLGRFVQHFKALRAWCTRRLPG